MTHRGHRVTQRKSGAYQTAASCSFHKTPVWLKDVPSLRRRRLAVVSGPGPGVVVAVLGERPNAGRVPRTHSDAASFRATTAKPIRAKGRREKPRSIQIWRLHQRNQNHTPTGRAALP